MGRPLRHLAHGGAMLHRPDSPCHSSSTNVLYVCTWTIEIGPAYESQPPKLYLALRKLYHEKKMLYEAELKVVAAAVVEVEKIVGKVGT